ncbi:MAG: NAD(P)-dependent oxidoreductase [Bacteroidota bacterium]|nr:NAD(P)-dependent oxidoreductase [Bacteroidota bacterium]MDP4229706.1 NAD(P)-dependent oxidoreductase [Bacteroidota bacterium]MDP4237315.1 NAD(P)-dependent oxidoreductase [Bacteroidota bacterium]
MNVLITGATGFLGSHAADRLLQDGHNVRAIVRGSSNLQWLNGKEVETVEASLHDPESLSKALKGIDAVVHVAGVTASKTKEGFYYNNQLATRNLLEATKLHGENVERFVLISSQTAGGPSLDGKPVTEETPPHPITTYGKSKLAAEEESRQFREYFPVTILRLPAIYGPRDTAILSFFQTVNKRIKPLIGFQEKFINLAHVYDIAYGIELGLTKPEALNRTFYIGSEKQYGWRELSNLAAELIGKKGVFVPIPHMLVSGIAGISEFVSIFKKKPSVLNWEKRLDITQPQWICSIERAQKELGYVPKVGIKEGFEGTIEWYKEQKWI